MLRDSALVANNHAIVISLSVELHLICNVIAELERKIPVGGLKATRCVNSPGPRLSIHLGILCHLQAVCMQAAEPRRWKTGWVSLQLSWWTKRKRDGAGGWGSEALREDGCSQSQQTNTLGLQQWNFYRAHNFFFLSFLLYAFDSHIEALQVVFFQMMTSGK